MTTYAEFFLNSKSNVVQLETLEISHPSFTKTYRVVRNAVAGITAKLENGSTVTFDYYPLKIDTAGTKNDLDQVFNISIGDLGELVPSEIDEVTEASTFNIRPTVIYRVYRSDDLNTVLFGPIILEIASFVFNKEGASFEAKAPSLSVLKTGEVYSLDRFPMLRGFL